MWPVKRRLLYLNIARPLSVPVCLCCPSASPSSYPRFRRPPLQNTGRTVGMAVSAMMIVGGLLFRREHQRSPLQRSAL